MNREPKSLDQNNFSGLIPNFSDLKNWESDLKNYFGPVILVKMHV